MIWRLFKLTICFDLFVRPSSGYKMSLEEAIQRKLYYRMYGTNFQRDLVVARLTNSYRKKYIYDLVEN